MECVPCQGGVPPLKDSEIADFLRKLGGGWQVINGHHLRKELSFPDFRTALDYTDKVGELAEREGHHPDICLSWGKVELRLWTHKIDGLTQSDFVFAAKVNELP
jgi:4a-hydroxytetrahydrobiopterin dehydratase